METTKALKIIDEIKEMHSLDNYWGNPFEDDEDKFQVALDSIRDAIKNNKPFFKITDLLFDEDIKIQQEYEERCRNRRKWRTFKEWLYDLPITDGIFDRGLRIPTKTQIYIKVVLDKYGLTTWEIDLFDTMDYYVVLNNFDKYIEQNHNCEQSIF